MLGAYMLRGEKAGALVARGNVCDQRAFYDMRRAYRAEKNKSYCKIALVRQNNHGCFLYDRFSGFYIRARRESGYRGFYARADFRIFLRCHVCARHFAYKLRAKKRDKIDGDRKLIWK